MMLGEVHVCSATFEIAHLSYSWKSIFIRDNTRTAPHLQSFQILCHKKIGHREPQLHVNSIMENMTTIAVGL
eukprot:5670320-Amphidinium_carterae.1